jgi:uncharacterized protein (DUF1778 family)
MSPSRGTRRATLKLRVTTEECRLIDRAAESAGKNRAEFVLEAAHSAAKEILLDRTVLAVSFKTYSEFLARLDAPPRPNQRLWRTMQTPAPWD